MTGLARRLSSLALDWAPYLLLALVVVGFSLASPRFRTLENAENILIQASAVTIVAVGMTLVLLTAGIDLSVGSAMFLGAAVAGKLALGGAPVIASLGAMLLVGLGCGLFNSLFVTRFRVAAFIVTLSTLFLFRGTALWITETRAMNLPDTFRQLATARLGGLPMPVLAMGATLAAGHLLLTRTVLGRHIYAVGHDAAGAVKAGLPVGRILTAVYVLCGLCAGLGGAVALAQLGAVSPTFGQSKEFAAIAAAVLGGTSLFGGRGSVLPGALLGALIIHTVEAGLNVVNADPYLYQMITSGIIFLAVLLDSTRHRLRTSRRRPIRRPDREDRTTDGKQVPA